MNIKKKLEKSLNHLRNNQFHEALKLLSQVLKYDPNQKDALSNMGLLQIKIGNKIEGRGYLEKSLKAEYDPQVANNLVLVLMEMQLWNEAELHNNKLILQYQSNPYYKLNKARILRFKMEATNLAFRR